MSDRTVDTKTDSIDSPLSADNDIENLFEIRNLPDFFKKPLAAAFFVGATAFACPGVFGALNGLGAGGGADPSTSNIANAITFGTIAVGGFLSGSILNRIGVKLALIIGASFYSPYAAALYVTNYHPSNKWFMPFAAFILGVSASFLWIASGAILLGYAEPKNKGKAMSIKISLQHLGASLGGAIALGMNHRKSSKKSITRATYLVLTFVMLVGIPFAILLPTPRQVQRSDKNRVIIRKQPSIWKEFAVLGRLMKDWKILCFLPILLYNQWYLSYQWGFNAHHFTVRGRALNSFLFYTFGMIGAWSAGLFLDSTRFTRQAKSKLGFIIFNVLAATCWILALAVEKSWESSLQLYDWPDKRYGLGCFIFCLWGLTDAIYNTYIYWIVGTLSDNINELSLLSGVVNGIGSLGSAMAFVISAKDVSPVAQSAICFGLYFFGVPFFAPLAWSVREDPVLEIVTDDEENNSSLSLEEVLVNDNSKGE